MTRPAFLLRPWVQLERLRRVKEPRLYGIRNRRTGEHRLAPQHIDSPGAAVIEQVFAGVQRTVTGTLENIGQLAASLKIGNPAMIIIGEVVAVRERLASLEAAAKSMIG